MKINLKTVCPEIIGRIPNGEYTVDDGLSAQQALIQCLESREMPLPESGLLTQLLYVINSRQVKADAPLQEGDKLMVLRPARGG